MLKIANDSANQEIVLLHEQYENTQNNLGDLQELGEELSNDLIDKISYQDERLADGNAELAREGAIVRELLAKEADVNSEEERLQKLRESYARLDAKLEDMTKSFDQSTALRTQARQRVSNIRKELKGNLNAEVPDMNLDEVEELCRKIQDQDETLLFDLGKLRMLVQVDEVSTNERNMLCNGIDQLKDQTDADQRHIDRLIKVIAKYEDKARTLRDKLEKLIEELRRLKNKLLIVRQETIRLNEEI